MNYPMTLKLWIQDNIIINFKRGKENLKSSKAGFVIAYYPNELGELTATVTPSSAALNTTLFIRA